MDANFERPLGYLVAGFFFVCASRARPSCLLDSGSKSWMRPGIKIVPSALNHVPQTFVGCLILIRTHARAVGGCACHGRTLTRISGHGKCSTLGRVSVICKDRHRRFKSTEGFRAVPVSTGCFTTVSHHRPWMDQ